MDGSRRSSARAGAERHECRRMDPHAASAQTLSAGRPKRDGPGMLPGPSARAGFPRALLAGDGLLVSGADVAQQIAPEEVVGDLLRRLAGAGIAGGPARRRRDVLPATAAAAAQDELQQERVGEERERPVGRDAVEAREVHHHRRRRRGRRNARRRRDHDSGVASCQPGSSGLWSNSSGAGVRLVKLSWVWLASNQLLAPTSGCVVMIAGWSPTAASSVDRQRAELVLDDRHGRRGVEDADLVAAEPVVGDRDAHALADHDPGAAEERRVVRPAAEEAAVGTGEGDGVAPDLNAGRRDEAVALAGADAHLVGRRRNRREVDHDARGVPASDRVLQDQRPRPRSPAPAAAAAPRRWCCRTGWRARVARHDPDADRALAAVAHGRRRATCPRRPAGSTRCS